MKERNKSGKGGSNVSENEKKPTVAFLQALPVASAHSPTPKTTTITERERERESGKAVQLPGLSQRLSHATQTKIVFFATSTLCVFN